MSAFTPHQRDILLRRVARAVLWADVSRSTETYRIGAAESTARAVVEELEVSGFSAAAQRRAIDKVIVNLEEQSALTAELFIAPIAAASAEGSAETTERLRQEGPSIVGEHSENDCPDIDDARAAEVPAQ